jgi:bifunctional DNA-binding transcriptional regulator/antitoxin component of YhaV-PrlF toxin-antitoxin module
MIHASRLSKEGRVLIAAELRKSLGLAPDELLNIDDKDGEIRIVSRWQGIRRAQAIMAKYKKPGHSVVDEFVREKRKHAARA